MFPSWEDLLIILHWKEMCFSKILEKINLIHWCKNSHVYYIVMSRAYYFWGKVDLRYGRTITRMYYQPEQWRPLKKKNIEVKIQTTFLLWFLLRARVELDPKGMLSIVQMLRSALASKGRPHIERCGLNNSQNRASFGFLQ